MKAYTVYLNGKEIDTVFWTNDSSIDEVRASLINHDGYDSSIVVSRVTPIIHKKAKKPKVRTRKQALIDALKMVSEYEVRSVRQNNGMCDVEEIDCIKRIATRALANEAWRAAWLSKK